MWQQGTRACSLLPHGLPVPHAGLQGAALGSSEQRTRPASDPMQVRPPPCCPGSDPQPHDDVLTHHYRQHRSTPCIQKDDALGRYFNRLQSTPTVRPQCKANRHFQMCSPSCCSPYDSHPFRNTDQPIFTLNHAYNYIRYHNKAISLPRSSPRCPPLPTQAGPPPLPYPLVPLTTPSA